MGLAEKISQAQAEARVEYQKRQETIATAERLRQEAENSKLQAALLADKENADKKIAFVAELTSLLDIVGAREQLEEVRKVWTVGEIDTTPQQISDIGWMLTDKKRLDYDLSLRQPLPGLGLALRYRYADIKEELGHDPGDPSAGELAGPARDYHQGSTVYECEARLYTIVGFTEKRMPFITAVYGQQKLDGTTYTKDGTSRPVIYDYFDTGHNALSYRKPETILPENPQSSREMLEGQLVALCRNITNPLDLESKAKEKIATDKYLPTSVKDRFDPKSVFSQQPVVSPIPWYRRLFS